MYVDDPKAKVDLEGKCPRPAGTGVLVLSDTEYCGYPNELLNFFPANDN